MTKVRDACIIYVKTLPPPELRHDLTIKDHEGRTCAMWWKDRIGEPVPSELLIH